MVIQRIDPKTHKKVRFFVKRKSGGTVSDALVTATIVSPTGHIIAADLACPYNSGDGAYLLEILPAWSTGLAGEAVEGVYEAQVTLTRFGFVRNRDFKYLVTFKTE
jgi:hypothetical protein